MSDDLTPEMRAALDSRGRNRLFAYYFGFDSTGSDEVDDLLAAVAYAGKAFHSTEQWGDDEYTTFTMVDLIQATANAAADEIDRLRAEIERAKALAYSVWHGDDLKTAALAAFELDDWAVTEDES